MHWENFVCKIYLLSVFLLFFKHTLYYFIALDAGMIKNIHTTIKRINLTKPLKSFFFNRLHKKVFEKKIYRWDTPELPIFSATKFMPFYNYVIIET